MNLRNSPFNVMSGTAILDKLDIARGPCSFATSEGSSSDDGPSSPRDDARSSERLDVSLPKTPPQSPFGTSSVDKLQLGYLYQQLGQNSRRLFGSSERCIKCTDLLGGIAEGIEFCVDV